MVEAAPGLAARSLGLEITHQTGERDLELVRDGYRRAGLAARVEPFLFDMAREMKLADLVVCRSGATTIAELTASARPAIFIPLPTAADDHQRVNAEVLVAAGAAELIEQRDADRRAARRTHRGARVRRGDAARDVGGGAPARASGCGRGDRRAGVRAARRGRRDARAHAADSLRRDRRYRDERHRRAPREPRIRGQRVRPQAVGRDRSAADARRPRSASATQAANVGTGRRRRRVVGRARRTTRRLPRRGRARSR